MTIFELDDLVCKSLHINHLIPFIGVYYLDRQFVVGFVVRHEQKNPITMKENPNQIKQNSNRNRRRAYNRFIFQIIVLLQATDLINNNAFCAVIK